LRCIEFFKDSKPEPEDRGAHADDNSLWATTQAILLKIERTAYFVFMAQLHPLVWNSYAAPFIFGAENPLATAGPTRNSPILVRSCGIILKATTRALIPR
jgi:hypothetical protein